MKAVILHIKGDDAKAVETGRPSALTKKVRAYKKVSDFPKGVDVIEVWSAVSGRIKRLSKAKLEAQAKADGVFESEEVEEEILAETPEDETPEDETPEDETPEESEPAPVTVAEFKQALDKLGVKYKAKATLAELTELYFQ